MRMIDWSSAVCSSDLRPSSDEAIFTAEKDPKRLAPGARRCGSYRTDSLRIWATAGRRRTRTSMCFKHRRLFPAVACAARRALRRVVALGPHIPVLLIAFSVPSHCIMALRHRAHVGWFKPRRGGTTIQTFMFLALFLCSLVVFFELV